MNVLELLTQIHRNNFEGDARTNSEKRIHGLLSENDLRTTTREPEWFAEMLDLITGQNTGSGDFGGDGWEVPNFLIALYDELGWHVDDYMVKGST